MVLWNWWPDYETSVTPAGHSFLWRLLHFIPKLRLSSCFISERRPRRNMRSESLAFQFFYQLILINFMRSVIIFSLHCFWCNTISFFWSYWRLFSRSSDSKGVQVGAELLCLEMPFYNFWGKTGLKHTGGNSGIFLSLRCAYRYIARMLLGKTWSFLDSFIFCTLTTTTLTILTLENVTRLAADEDSFGQTRLDSSGCMPVCLVCYWNS
jgi:hypothetical protein